MNKINNKNVLIEIKKHKYTPQEKLEWFGDGEWIEEPDLVEFTYNNYNCEIKRIAIQEPYSKKFHMFGGHLCAYVCIPSDHPYYNKEYGDMEIDCHWGLTFGEVSEHHWIGFDCAHSGDKVLSTEKLNKLFNIDRLPKPEHFKNLPILPKPEHFKNLPIFNPTYKNIQFCINECIKIVDQLIEIQSEK